MKKTVLIIWVLLIFTSCFNKTGQKQKDKQSNQADSPIDNTNRPTKHLEDHKLIFKPDTTIGKICLENSKNINEYLGKNVMKRLVDNGFPHSDVLSSDEKQKLTFYFHPGNVTKRFSEFKVEYVTQMNKNTRVTPDKEFKTESGIRLGIPLTRLKAIKGKPDSIVKSNAITILRYQINNYKNSKFLQRYNMPEYYSDYKFENDRLIEFKFGFVYP